MHIQSHPDPGSKRKRGEVVGPAPTGAEQRAAAVQQRIAQAELRRLDELLLTGERRSF